MIGAVAFVCNVCGRQNSTPNFATEPASCPCGSNVRVRALIHLLSLELFGHSMVLADFPVMKSIRGLGMTDKACYADVLANKFDYKNTHYDREPRLDFTQRHPELYGQFDFILSGDVLEHVAGPVERTLEEAFSLLNARGIFGITVYCNPADSLQEHFPELNDYRLVQLGEQPVLINRRRDGTLEIKEDLIFHGGPGATLEMREFGITGLQSKLREAGFRGFEILTANVPEFGIIFDSDVSQPLLARKEPFVLTRPMAAELVQRWQEFRDQSARAWEERDQSARALEDVERRMRVAAESKWVRLGKRLGLGPEL